jgi:hypothetical protein
MNSRRLLQRSSATSKQTTNAFTDRPLAQAPPTATSGTIERMKMGMNTRFKAELTIFLISVIVVEVFDMVTAIAIGLNGRVSCCGHGTR